MTLGLKSSTNRKVHLHAHGPAAHGKIIDIAILKRLAFALARLKVIAYWRRKCSLEIYLVGGAVRDQLLNRPIHERDWVVVGATPEDLIAQGYRQVGKDFPVFIHPQTGEEYALARTERKTGRGYNQFACYAAPDVTLEQDLLRRDITINAMALSDAGQLIDPYGGRQDLQAKVIRHVSPAFIEDPVRLLRVARFAARYAPLGFTIADETRQLMYRMVTNGEIDALVPERVWQELTQALTEEQPQQFFFVLRTCGALSRLFPELDNLFGIPNPPKWHPEIDSGIHTLMVLESAARLSADPKIRFAALLHDLGKALTPRHLWPKHPGHEQKTVALIKGLAKRYKIPKDYTALALIVGHYHGHAHKAFELRPETLLRLLEALDAFRRPERFQAFLTACLADAQGRPGYTDTPYPQAEYLQAAKHSVDQIDIKPLLTQGLQGTALRDALKQMRISQLKAFKQTYPTQG